MSSGWGEQPASDSAPEPTTGSAPEGGADAAAGAGGGGGVMVPVLIIVVVLLVLGGGAAAFLLLRPDRPDPNANPTPSLPTPTPVPVSASPTPEEESPTPEETAMPEPPATPVNTGMPQISGTATVGQVLTTTPGSWQNQSSLQFAFGWASCASMDSKTCVVITGADDHTYVVNAADEGKLLLSVVTAANADGETTQVQSGVVGPAAAAAPQLVLVPEVVDDRYAEAVDKANQVGLTILRVGYSDNISNSCNTVVETQNPEPPAQLPIGSTIKVTTDRPPKSCLVMKDPGKVKIKQPIGQAGG